MNKKYAQYEHILYHAIIDMNKADKDNNIKIDILQTKSMKTIPISIWSPLSFSYMFRIGYKMYIVCQHIDQTWIVDLKSGKMYPQCQTTCW